MKCLSLELVKIMEIDFADSLCSFQIGCLFSVNLHCCSWRALANNLAMVSSAVAVTAVLVGLTQFVNTVVHPDTRFAVN